METAEATYRNDEQGLAARCGAFGNMADARMAAHLLAQVLAVEEDLQHPHALRAEVRRHPERVF